jgi:hypothetical protein
MCPLSITQTNDELHFVAQTPSLYPKAKNWLMQPMIFSWQLILIPNNPGCFLQMSQIFEKH